MLTDFLQKTPSLRLTLSESVPGKRAPERGQNQRQVGQRSGAQRRAHREEVQATGRGDGTEAAAPESAIVLRPIAAVMKSSRVTWMNASESKRNMPAP